MVRPDCHLQGSHILLNLRRLGLHKETSRDTTITAIAFNSRSRGHLNTTLRTASDTTMNDTLELKELYAEGKIATTRVTTPQIV
jgi:hypothetical protein